ncbi:hypothetical protein R3W88_001127 [Solanum pinnatisectum]|uniref:Uncharacterized protein n=1 Tax=Solanum pinnatisectum TaxID=50273 RepID=A0AAV9MK83_9SOLN|nr:hypothetical protein R3W88_001127 [Solanum pinnatisectum]
MSDMFPCGSWPYHSVPNGQQGFDIAAQVRLCCAFPLDFLYQGVHNTSLNKTKQAVKIHIFTIILTDKLAP